MTWRVKRTMETLHDVAARAPSLKTQNAKSILLQGALVILLVRAAVRLLLNDDGISESVQVLRILYTVWAVLHLSITSFVWSLIVIGVLLLGLTAARNQQRFLLMTVRAH